MSEPHPAFESGDRHPAPPHLATWNEMGDSEWNDLLRRAQAGRKHAADELLALLRIGLLRVAQGRLWNGAAAEAEDVVQETLLAVYGKLRGIHDRPYAYALAVLRRKIADALRQRKPGAAPSPEARPSPPPAPELRRRLERALRSLPATCRELLLLLARGYDNSDLYTMFPELEPGTIRVRIKRCRDRLRVEL